MNVILPWHRQDASIVLIDIPGLLKWKVNDVMMLKWNWCLHNVGTSWRLLDFLDGLYLFLSCPPTIEFWIHDYFGMHKTVGGCCWCMVLSQSQIAIRRTHVECFDMNSGRPSAVCSSNEPSQLFTKFSIIICSILVELMLNAGRWSHQWCVEFCQLTVCDGRRMLRIWHDCCYSLKDIFLMDICA